MGKHWFQASRLVILDSGGVDLLRIVLAQRRHDHSEASVVCFCCIVC